jgi:hypothetical protein
MGCQKCSVKDDVIGTRRVIPAAAARAMTRSLAPSVFDVESAVEFRIDRADHAHPLEHFRRQVDPVSVKGDEIAHQPSPRFRSSWAISATIRAPARTKHALGGASILIGSRNQLGMPPRNPRGAQARGAAPPLLKSQRAKRSLAAREMFIDHRLDFPAWPQEQMETNRVNQSVAKMVASDMKAIKIYDYHCTASSMIRQAQRSSRQRSASLAGDFHSASASFFWHAGAGPSRSSPAGKPTPIFRRNWRLGQAPS